jgi:hypothetical protein
MCGAVTHQDLVPWHGVGDPVANRLPSGGAPHCQQAVRGEAYQNCRQRNAPSTAACPEPCGGLLCHSTASQRPRWAACHARWQGLNAKDGLAEQFVCKAVACQMIGLPFTTEDVTGVSVCDRVSRSIDIAANFDA